MIGCPGREADQLKDPDAKAQRRPDDRAQRLGPEKAIDTQSDQPRQGEHEADARDPSGPVKSHCQR